MHKHLPHTLKYMKLTLNCNISAILRQSYLLLIGLVSIVTSRAQENHQSSNFNDEYVLIINTHTAESPWSNAIIEPVQRWIAAKRKAVFVEHMNMLMISSVDDFHQFEKSMLVKYGEKSPEVVLMLGNPSLLMRYEIRRRWGDVPMILCAEYDFTGPDLAYIEQHPIPLEQRIPISELSKDYNLTYLQTRIFVDDNVKLLRHMIPGIKEVLLIGDGRYVNQQLNYDTKRLMSREYPELEYHFMSAAEMTLEDLLSKLDTIDISRTGVLFYSWFSTLKIVGQDVLHTNSYRMIANLSAPIFSLENSVMHNSGMVGGYFYNDKIFRDNLQKAINAALSGMSMSEIQHFIPDESIPIFNYPSLLINNLSEDKCPVGSVFIEKPKTFYDNYKYFLIFGGVMVAASLSFAFMLYRIRSLNALSKAQQQQFQTSRELTRLFENMPVAYMKAKLIRDKADEIVDLEVCQMNGRFMLNFAEGKISEKCKGSELWGSDLTLVMRFVKLADAEQRTITYTQYFTTANIYLNIVITPAMQPGHIDAYYVDATELYNTQEKLYDTNRKLSMTLEVANIVPWNWNLREHKILCDINRPIELSDAKQNFDDDKLSVPDTQYFSKILKEDKERVVRAYNDLIEGRTTKVQEEYRIVSRDKDKYRIDWVEAQATVEQLDDDGKPLTLVGSSLVITQRKKMEQDLIDARDKAEESNRLKSAFLANMSHEIRTPLNAIVGFSGLLNSMDEPEEREEYVKIIENNNELLLQLIGDILDLSKIEAGTLEFVETPVDINSLMEETTRALQIRAKEKGLTITFKDSLPECHIMSDRNRLNQVLTNLITNAIKFTKEGGITTGYSLQDDGMLKFYVTDTGCGISPQKQNDIFERFVKLDSFAQGTGLGLSICRTIVTRMGGQIGVESKQGEGSMFWFTVPNTTTQSIERAVQTYTIKAVAKSDITILVAEDNVSNFKLFETILQKDYNIIHAWNGVEAVELFKKHNPHIVLMDISMPVMDGYEATIEIRKLSTNVPILAVTAYAYAADEQQIMNHGFDGYTPKPISPNALKSKITDLLSMRLMLL